MGGRIKDIFSKKLTFEEITNVLLTLIVVVMPYIVMRGYNSFYREGKVAFNYVIGFLLLILMIVKRDKVKYKQQKIAIVFLLTLLISSIFSPYKSVAFFGIVTRDEGFFMLLVYVVLYIASANHIKITEKKLVLWIISADVMALYGIMQFWKFDIVSMIVKAEKPIITSIGFIGNRNFFSTYLVIFLFIAFTLYIFFGSKRYLIMSIPLFAALLCTLTRSGWVAFLVVSLLGFLTIMKRSDCIKRGIIVFISYALVFTVINVFSDGGILSRGKTIINDTVNFDDDSGSHRIEIWKMGLEIFKARPLIGSGPDTFKMASMDICPERATKFIITTNTYADKAHNEFIEYMAAGGILTLLAYIVFVLSILKGLWVKRKSDIAKIFMLFLGGYLVQSFFNISVVMVAPIFWIFLGVITKIINEDNILKNIENHCNFMKNEAISK